MEYEQRKCADYWASSTTSDINKAKNVWFCIDNSGNSYYESKLKMPNVSDRNS
jgi:hypothetical protein